MGFDVIGGNPSILGENVPWIRRGVVNGDVFFITFVSTKLYCALVEVVLENADLDDTEGNDGLIIHGFTFFG